MDIPEPDTATELGEIRNWTELPRDITASILSRLGGLEILTSALHVCSTWRTICREASMWRHVDMRDSGGLWDMVYDLEELCRTAVDLSQGCVEVINIECFGTDDLLLYVAERARHLKHLQLVSCYNISDEGLTAVAAKMPLLEELDFSFCSFSKEALEVIGHCCPLIKSFKLNSRAYKHAHVESDEEALVIAQNMPRLVHLQMFGNKLTNVGLQAILDGCPCLESLDLRQCFNVKLDGHLGKICTERIKDLRHPYDPIDDYPLYLEIANSGIGSSSGVYPSGYSDIDFISDFDDYFEFSDGTAFGDFDDDYQDWYFGF